MPVDKSKMTPEQLEEFHRKRREADRRRKIEREKRLKENIAIIGKEKMAANRQEAREVVDMIDEIKIRKMTPEEVDAKVQKFEDEYKKNNQLYKERQKQKDDAFMKNATPEEIEKYIKARRITKSATRAAELTKLPDAKFEKMYKNFLKKQQQSQKAAKERRKANAEKVK